MLDLFLGYFFLFFIYSIIGWITETTYIAIKYKKWVDRGFLIGPYCPIYGIGSVVIIFYLTQYKENFLTVFILGMFICSALEYFTSYIMEKLFKARWWDYSDRKFNLNGRICGFNSLLFGIGSIAIIYIFQPILELLLLITNSKILFIINITSLIIFAIDTIISFNVAKKFEKTVLNLNIKKDSTIEFSKLVRETIKNNNKILQKRLFCAFPNIDFQKIIELKKELQDDIKDFLRK